MIDGITFLFMAAMVAVAPWFIGKAREHDARLEPAESVDWDAIEEEAETQAEDDADSFRKGER